MVFAEAAIKLEISVNCNVILDKNFYSYIQQLL